MSRRSTYDLEMAEAKQASDLPVGTVTFLLTDVEGSTRLWEAHPQAMEQALARHGITA
jgi:class 3 adenylate cyclase